MQNIIHYLCGDPSCLTGAYFHVKHPDGRRWRLCITHARIKFKETLAQGFTCSFEPIEETDAGELELVDEHTLQVRNDRLTKGR